MSREIVEIRYNWRYDIQNGDEHFDFFKVGDIVSTPWFQGKVIKITQGELEKTCVAHFEKGYIIIYNPNMVVYRNKTGGKI